MIECWAKNKEIADFIYNSFNPHPYMAEVLKSNSGYRISFRNKSLDLILPLIMPFMRFKKKHAEIMLKYRETYEIKFSRKGVRGSVPVQPEIEEIRRNCFEELRKLNGLYTQ